MEKNVGRILQSDNLSFIENQHGKDLWVTVYKIDDKEMDEKNSHRFAYYSCLIPQKIKTEVLNNINWDLSMGGGHPCCHGDGSYYKYGEANGIEPLVLIREFGEFEKSYVEVSEEFRLFHKLYYRDNIYYKIDSLGTKHEVIKITDSEVNIRLTEIKQFLSIKEMYLSLQFELKFFSNIQLDEIGISEIRKDISKENLKYSYYVINSHYDYYKSYSSISGKKIIQGINKEDSGVWPYEKKEKYEEFIIGHNDDGDEMLFSCNPNELNDIANNHEGNPHYLTPVVFNKDVLNFYYTDDKNYSVKDEHIICGNQWGLPVDLEDKDYVITYLGDLGKIPYKAQSYWKSFNVLSSKKISDVKFKRDFMCKFTSPEILDLKFKEVYKQFSRQWRELFGWPFFIELKEKDKYNIENLRIPVIESQVEFDTQVLSLVKVLIDALNEKEIARLIEGDTEKLKGIQKLTKFLEEKDIKGYEEHIQFLKDLQNLRSSGTGHIKGSNYEKFSKKFQITENNFKEVFEKILNSTINFLEFMENSFLKTFEK